jgi:PqqD family protein of HPr-rel-A system
MPGPIYVADGPEVTRSIALDGLAALYHRPSGATHILAPPAPQILEALVEGPADAVTIRARIAERFEIEGDEEALAARLEELLCAGLVRIA